jgi:hypothetical protein
MEIVIKDKRKKLEREMADMKDRIVRLERMANKGKLKHNDDFMDRVEAESRSRLGD